MSDGLTKALITIQDKNPSRLAVVFCETLIKILTNIVDHPADEKYRSLKCNNPAIRQKVLECRGADELLKSTGWRTIVIDMAEVLIFEGDNYDLLRSVIAKLTKLQGTLQAKHAGQKPCDDGERQLVLRRLEEDRRARAERALPREASSASPTTDPRRRVSGAGRRGSPIPSVPSDSSDV